MLQPTPTASYSLTLRVRLSSRAGSLGELTMAIGRAGGDIGAIDIVNVGNNYIIRDITVSSASSAHGEQIVETVKNIDGVDLLQVSDPTFLMHLGGKIEVVSKVPLTTRSDLSMAYTPGVARICDAILVRHPALVLVDEQGRPERLTGAGVDITERKPG